MMEGGLMALRRNFPRSPIPIQRVGAVATAQGRGRSTSVLGIDDARQADASALALATMRASVARSRAGCIPICPMNPIRITVNWAIAPGVRLPRRQHVATSWLLSWTPGAGSSTKQNPRNRQASPEADSSTISWT